MSTPRRVKGVPLRIAFAVLKSKTPYIAKAVHYECPEPAAKRTAQDEDWDQAWLHSRCRLIALEVRRQHHYLVRLGLGTVTSSVQCLSR